MCCICLQQVLMHYHAASSQRLFTNVSLRSSRPQNGKADSHRTVIPSLHPHHTPSTFCYNRTPKDNMAALHKGTITLYIQKNIFSIESQVIRVVSWRVGKYVEVKRALCKREGSSAHYSSHLKGCDLGFPFRFRHSTVIWYSNIFFILIITQQQQ